MCPGASSAPLRPWPRHRRPRVPSAPPPPPPPRSRRPPARTPWPTSVWSDAWPSSLSFRDRRPGRERPPGAPFPPPRHAPRPAPLLRPAAGRDRGRRLREQTQGKEDGGRRQAAADQPRPQEVTPPRDPHPDRADRPPELPRHGLVRESLDVAEHQRGAILLREPAEFLVEGRVQLVALEAVVVVHLRATPGPAAPAPAAARRRPAPRARRVGRRRTARGRPTPASGPSRPCGPAAGRSPGTRPPRRAGRGGCGGRRPAPSARAGPRGRGTRPGPTARRSDPGAARRTPPPRTTPVERLRRPEPGCHLVVVRHRIMSPSTFDRCPIVGGFAPELFNFFQKVQVSGSSPGD